MGDIIKTVLKIVGIVMLIAVLGAIIFNEFQQNKKINELLENKTSQSEDGEMTQIQVESIISSYLTKNGYVAGEDEKYVQAENLKNEVTKILKEENVDDDTYEKLEDALKSYIDEKLAEKEKDAEEENDKDKEDKDEKKKTTTTKKNSSSSSSKKTTTNNNQTAPQAPSTPSVTPPPSNAGNTDTSSDDAFVVDDDESVIE